MLLPNLYGSIMGSVVAGLVGGPGIATGINVGENHMMFEQGARHPAKDLVAGKTGNPIAFILSAANMLRHLDQAKWGDALQKAVYEVISEQRVRTPDLGGHNTMDDVTKEICSKFRCEGF
jgi:isocitrate dehydrogenase (NAD+)